MPGLPRKSTLKQFKNLIKKSKKSKTNTAYGGTDTSLKKISTYEQFINLNEDKKFLVTIINSDTGKVMDVDMDKFEDLVDIGAKTGRPLIHDLFLTNYYYDKDEEEILKIINS